MSVPIAVWEEDEKIKGVYHLVGPRLQDTVTLVPLAAMCTEFTIEQVGTLYAVVINGKKEDEVHGINDACTRAEEIVVMVKGLK